MNKKYFLAAIVAASLSIAPAMAADFGVVAADTAITYAVSNWSGAYAGLNGIVQNRNGVTEAGLGATVGYNVHDGVFLYGIEGQILGLDDTDNFDVTELDYYAQVTGKAGVVVSDNAAVYALAGLSTNVPDVDDSHALLGAGAEFVVTDTVNAKFEYTHGFSLSDSTDFDRVTAGLVVKF